MSLLQVFDLCVEALVMAELEGHVFICSIELRGMPMALSRIPFGTHSPFGRRICS